MLSTVERLVFRGDAMLVARDNAWSAVQVDRQRARERAEAWAALDREPAQDEPGRKAADDRARRAGEPARKDAPTQHFDNDRAWTRPAGLPG